MNLSKLFIYFRPVFLSWTFLRSIKEINKFINKGTSNGYLFPIEKNSLSPNCDFPNLKKKSFLGHSLASTNSCKYH